MLEREGGGILIVKNHIKMHPGAILMTVKNHIKLHSGASSGASWRHFGGCRYRPYCWTPGKNTRKK